FLGRAFRSRRRARKRGSAPSARDPRPRRRRALDRRTDGRIAVCPERQRRAARQRRRTGKRSREDRPLEDIGGARIEPHVASSLECCGLPQPWIAAACRRAWGALASDLLRFLCEGDPLMPEKRTIEAARRDKREGKAP